MSGTKPRSRRLGVEDLERRALLAGDVAVSVVDGNLLINGDELDNAISIAAGATADAVLVTGLDTAGVATTINGAAVAGGVEFTGVSGDILIRMGDGNDSVAVGAMTVQGLRIRTGRGDDDVALGAGLVVEGNLKVQTDGGDDSVTAVDTTIHGNAQIETGFGDDDVSLSGVVVIQTDEEEEDGEESAENGHGGIGPLGRVLGALFGHNDEDYCGSDEDYDESGQCLVDTGFGDDSVLINGLTAAKLKVHTGNGDDSATLAGIVAAKIDLDLGRGDDTASIAASTTDRLMAKLGDGDDELSISADVAISASLKLDGGRGIDSLVSALPANVPLNLLRKGFESIA